MKRTLKVRVGSVASALDRFEETWRKAARGEKAPAERPQAWKESGVGDRTRATREGTSGGDATIARMNAPESRRRLAPSRKPTRARKPRRSKVFIAELRRQCRLANQSDRRDNWQAFIHLPE